MALTEKFVRAVLAKPFAGGRKTRSEIRLKFYIALARNSYAVWLPLCLLSVVSLPRQLNAVETEIHP